MSKFGRGFVSALASVLLLVVMMGSTGSVLVTKGVSKTEWDYCVALIAAIDDDGGGRTKSTDIDADIAVAAVTTLDWDDSSYVASDCSKVADCTDSCYNDVCSGPDGRTSQVVKAEIWQDSAGEDYCWCKCEDTNPEIHAFIYDCAD